MSITVTVGNATFKLAQTGENIGWGEEELAFKIAVAEALGTVQGVNDIPITTQTISNNVTTLTNIIGFAHNNLNTRAFQAEFSIKRVYNTGSGDLTLVESGSIEGTSDGTDWFISIESVGDSQTILTITSSGQIQYTSSNLTGYVSGDIKFKSKSIDV